MQKQLQLFYFSILVFLIKMFVYFINKMQHNIEQNQTPKKNLNYAIQNHSTNYSDNSFPVLLFNNLKKNNNHLTSERTLYKQQQTSSITQQKKDQRNPDLSYLSKEAVLPVVQQQDITKQQKNMVINNLDVINSHQEVSQLKQEVVKNQNVNEKQINNLNKEMQNEKKNQESYKIQSNTNNIIEQPDKKEVQQQKLTKLETIELPKVQKLNEAYTSRQIRTNSINKRLFNQTIQVNTNKFMSEFATSQNDQREKKTITKKIHEDSHQQERLKKNNQKMIIFNSTISTTNDEKLFGFKKRVSHYLEKIDNNNLKLTLKLNNHIKKGQQEISKNFQQNHRYADTEDQIMLPKHFNLRPRENLNKSIQDKRIAYTPMINKIEQKSEKKSTSYLPALIIEKKNQQTSTIQNKNTIQNEMKYQNRTMNQNQSKRTSIKQQQSTPKKLAQGISSAKQTKMVSNKEIQIQQSSNQFKFKNYKGNFNSNKQQIFVQVPSVHQLVVGKSQKQVMKRHHSIDQNFSEQKVQELIQQFKSHSQFFQKMDISKFVIKKYKNGVYFGQLKETQNSYPIKQGVGSIFYYNGRLYQGQFLNDLKHGKGLQLYPDGSYYQGQFEKGQKQGKGRFVWNNGEIYDGQWHKGKKHGSGMWKSSNVQPFQSYIGEWSQGKVEGFGVHTTSKGVRYQGEFKNSLKQGLGTQRFQNGDVYVGAYSKSRQDGYGEYYFQNGDVYKGDFRNSLKHGKGILKQAKTGNIYQGLFKNDKISGLGQYFWKNGDKYQGSFQNELKHGYGEFTTFDGKVYKGYWFNDKMLGDNIKIQKTKKIENTKNLPFTNQIQKYLDEKVKVPAIDNSNNKSISHSKSKKKKKGKSPTQVQPFYFETQHRRQCGCNKPHKHNH